MFVSSIYFLLLSGILPGFIFPLSFDQHTTLTSISQGWYRPSQNEMQGDICWVFWERLSYLHWPWWWGLELTEASFSHESRWPFEEGRARDGKKLTLRTYFQWAGPEVGHVPSLSVRHAKNFPFYCCKLELGFLLEWKDSWLIVTTSAAFFRFWVNFRGTLLLHQRIDLQAVHLMTDPGSCEAWWEGLGMFCLKNRRLL